MAKWFGADNSVQLAEIAELKSENGTLASNMELIQESMADLIMAVDNQGWAPMGDEFQQDEVPLFTIKRTALTTRALATINPLAKRGINVRTAYIWGDGVAFDGLPEGGDAFLNASTTKKYLTSAKSQEEMELALATDGNYFLKLSKGGTFYSQRKSVQRVPFYQITGTVSSPDNREEIWFYRREWMRVDNSESDDTSTERLFIEYVPAIDYDAMSNGRPRQMRGYPVNYGSVIAHHAVNKQVTWRWGVPDLMPVMYWLKAHKEFLENQATLVKALSRFAWKATAPTANGARAAATKVGTPAARDPRTGEQQDIGGTFVGAMGTTLSSVGRTGGSVDFKAGLPLAGYVAAGLSVPLNELTADAGDANRSSAETLSDSNEKVMQLRQQEHKNFLEDVLSYFGYTATLNFPPITSDPAYRKVQSVVAAAELNLMSDEEVRTLLLEIFDIETDAGMPTEEQMANLLLSITLAGEQAKEAKAAAQQQADKTALGKDTSGAKSYGDNSNRDAVGQHAYTNGKNG